VRTAPHRVVDVWRDAQDAAGTIPRVVEPQLAVGDDEHLSFVVSVHRIGVVGRVLDVLHPGGRVDARSQGLDPDAVAVSGTAFVVDPGHVVLVDAEDLRHSHPSSAVWAIRNATRLSGVDAYRQLELIGTELPRV
jgi:hypothetical protein